MPTRLIVAYALIVLLAAGAVAIVWWRVHHSSRRTEARRGIQRRRAEAEHSERFERKGRDG